MENFKVIIVEDVPLELKGTEGLLRNEVPEAEVIGTASDETQFIQLMRSGNPDLILLDLGLGGSTTIGVEICRSVKVEHPEVKVLIFTGEILNEKLWVDALDAGADGIILKTGEMLTRADVISVMSGRKYVFNQPIMDAIYEIDEYDERFLRHLALGYTKDQIAGLRGMPFGVKSLEKRQMELTQKLFPGGNGKQSVNAVRLVTRAFQLHILDPENLFADEE